MKITIFAKKRQSKEGRAFVTYLTTLAKKDGTSDTMQVKFKTDDVPEPTKCPMNIDIDRTTCNISTKTYTDEMTGEVGTSKTLWVMSWAFDSPYVDLSMDEYV